MWFEDSNFLNQRATDCRGQQGTGLSDDIDAETKHKLYGSDSSRKAPQMTYIDSHMRVIQISIPSDELGAPLHIFCFDK